jgi:hypothetical protein
MAQNVPSGWKVVKDSKQMCQIAVPADWTSDAIVKSMASDPAKKSTAIVHWARQNSFAQTVSTAKQMMKPVKVFEESGSRIWYSYQPNSAKPATHWYIAAQGKNVCNADVSFEEAGAEDTAKKIAQSLGDAK